LNDAFFHIQMNLLILERLFNMLTIFIDFIISLDKIVGCHLKNQSLWKKLELNKLILGIIFKQS